MFQSIYCGGTYCFASTSTHQNALEQLDPSHNKPYTGVDRHSAKWPQGNWFFWYTQHGILASTAYRDLVIRHGAHGVYGDVWVCVGVL